LNKNIIKYVDFFDIDKIFNIKRIYDLKDNVIIKKHVNNADKPNNADKLNSVEIKHKSYLDDDKNRKLFSFIWILNDYDGEIIFWNEYTIKPQKRNVFIISKFMVFSTLRNFKIKSNAICYLWEHLIIVPTKIK